MPPQGGLTVSEEGHVSIRTPFVASVCLGREPAAAVVSLEPHGDGVQGRARHGVLGPVTDGVRGQGESLERQCVRRPGAEPERAETRAGRRYLVRRPEYWWPAHRTRCGVKHGKNSRIVLGRRYKSIGYGRIMADGVGFEPTRRFGACRFSRPVPSTARPPIHGNVP